MSSLAGKQILVTGAGSGIGRVAARRFHELGAELILVGRRQEKLLETLPGARCESLDHSDACAVAELAHRLEGLDGMFLNAGQLILGSVEASSVEDFDRMMAANLRGPWLCAHCLGPKLRPGASVVLMGSNLGLRALGNSAAYCVAKAGVHMLAQVLALEWAPRGIRCNALAPGPVMTDMVRERLASAQDPLQALSELSKVNPMGRMGREEEIAALVAHLLSDEASWTQGAVIPIDGGASSVFLT